MLGPFLAAIRQQLTQEAQRHAAQKAAGYMSQGRPEAVDAIIAQFLDAVSERMDSNALSMCTTEFQESLAAEGAAARFAAVRECLLKMSGFEHAPPKFDLLRASCDLTGTIQHEQGESSTYQFTLVRTGEDFWDKWKVKDFHFSPIPDSRPALRREAPKRETPQQKTAKQKTPRRVRKRSS
jgi:hypothetical protein